MAEPTAGDVAFACMFAFVDELAPSIAGACIAPGSRSAPLALALERHPDVAVHVHLDERSAAFFALGLARATRKPAVVACTSGTAAANFLPAVVEARQGGVPLIVLTADRPPELRGTGANQTIDQVELYGRYPVAFVDAEVSVAHPNAATYWRDLALRALEAATQGPGPVHINLPFREPLIPSGATVTFGETARDNSQDPVPRPERTEAPPEALLTPRAVILAGILDEPTPEIAALADATGWPLIAEPLSNMRAPGSALAAGQFLVMDRAFADAHEPDLVVQFGATPVTRASQALAARAKHLIVASPRPADPDRRASWTSNDPRAAARGLLDVAPKPDEDWARAWNDADARARAAVDSLLDSWDGPFEGRVARDLFALVPSDATLFVASSMPVRDLDAYAAPRDGVRTLANRGASGIDGTVSTILGVAASGARTYALVGDLALLHDASGLLWGARRGEDAVIVVLDNGGGGIFDLLPQAALAEHERLFVTPHGLDIGALAAAARAGHERIARASELGPAVSRAASSGGVAIVEVPIDRARALEQRAAVRDVVARAVESV